MNWRKWIWDLIIMGGLGILPFFIFGDVTFAGQTMIPADNLFQWQPWQTHAQQMGIDQPQNHLLSDMILQNYQWKQFVQSSLKQQEIPLWNPYLFGGVPFLAAGQHGAYYPFSWLFLWMPVEKSYGWYIVSQLWLAGISSYFLARALGLRRESGALAGLAYQGCGFLVVSAAVFPMIVGAAVWLPMLLGCMTWVARETAKGRRGGQRIGNLANGQPIPKKGGMTLWWVAIGSVGLGCQILAGHIEISYYTLLVMAGYGVWLLGMVTGDGEQKTERFERMKQWVQQRAKLGWRLAMIVLLGLMLGGIQFVPFYEVGQTNFREGSATLAEIQGWSFPSRRLVAFLLPNFFGNPAHHGFWDVWSGEFVPLERNYYGELNPNGAGTTDWGIKNYVEGGAYWGILSLVLAGIGAWMGIYRQFWRRTAGFFVLLALLSLSFVFGTPLYALLYYGLPGINQLHSPFRWIFPLSVAVAVLVGFGAEYLIERREKAATMPAHSPSSSQTNPKAINPFSTIIGLLVSAGLVIWLTLGLSWLFFDQLQPILERIFLGLALAANAFPHLQAFYSYQFGQLFWLGLMLLLSAGIIGVSQKNHYWKGKMVWVVIAGIVLGADLFWVNRGFHAAVHPSLLQFKPELLAWLEKQEGLWRLTTFDPHGTKPLNANVGWSYGLQDVRGYESVIPKQYVQYMQAIEPQTELPFNRIQAIHSWEALHSPLLDLLGVRYLVTTEQEMPAHYQLVWSGEGLFVYQNLAEVERAYSLPITSTIITDDVLEQMRHFDPRQYVIVSAEDWENNRSVAETDQPIAGQRQPAQLISYQSNEVIVQAQVTNWSWIILNDSYAPGWNVYLRSMDGAERLTTTIKVNGNFRGVLVPAGNWQIRYRYSPLSFKIGGLVSFMGGAILLFLGMVWAWRRFFPTSAELTNTRSVAKNSLAPMGLNLFNRLIDFVFAAFYLRLLGPEDSGSYATAITIAGLYEIVANWGLYAWIVREVAPNKQKADYYLVNSTILRLATAIVGTLPIGLYGLGRMLSGNPLNFETGLALAFLMVGMIFSGMGQGLTGLFYAYEQAEMPAFITTITTLLRLFLGVVVLLLGYSFVGLAAVSILVNIITLIILFTIARKRLGIFAGTTHLLATARAHLDSQLQRQMFRASYPLMLNHLLSTIFNFIDTPLLQQFQGDKVVGWYDSAYKYIRAFNIIPSFFTIALFPIISRQLHHSTEEVRRTFRLSAKLLILLSLPFATFSTFFAYGLIQFLGGSAFLPDGAIALQLLAWSMPIGWLNSLTNYVLIALGQERIQTRAFIIGVTFNLLANWLFIPLFSYKAAALVTIFSELILLLIFYRYLTRKISPIGWLQLLWKPIAATAISAAAIGFGFQLHWIVGLLAGLAAYPISLLLLQTFGAEEKQILSSLLPSSWRNRLSN